MINRKVIPAVHWPKVCDVCHHMTQNSMSFNEFAIANVRKENYILNFWHMTKNETIDRIESSYLSKKADKNENEKYYLL